MGNQESRDLMGSFDACFNFTVDIEGGYNNDITGGGPTKFGITLATLSAWRGQELTAEDVEFMGIDEARAIYQHNYWQPILGDYLPQSLALCTFDAAVNSGPRQAIRWLQYCVSVRPDGVMGPLTVAAAKKCDNGEIVNDLLNIRLAFMKGLKNWPENRNGWVDRLTNLRCEAL